MTWKLIDIVLRYARKEFLDCTHYLRFLFMGIVTYRDNLAIFISRDIFLT